MDDSNTDYELSNMITLIVETRFLNGDDDVGHRNHGEVRSHVANPIHIHTLADGPSHLCNLLFVFVFNEIRYEV